MLQYKIPQDVQIEDKILGPLTLKQLLMVAVGGGISYSIFLIISEIYFLSFFDYFWIAIPLLISLAFAFVRINDVSFLKWLLLLYEFAHNSRRRKWDKTETARLHFAFVTAKTGEPESKKKKKGKAQSKKKAEVPGKKNFSSLEELTHMLDHHSPFEEQEKSLATDHEDDHSLHLTAEEKMRHEQRLEQAKTSSPPAKLKKKAAPKAKKEMKGASKTQNTAKHQDTPKANPSGGIDFTDLKQGGSVSFS